jgi:hypothetical protein
VVVFVVDARLVAISSLRSEPARSMWSECLHRGVILANIVIITIVITSALAIGMAVVTATLVDIVVVEGVVVAAVAFAPLRENEAIQ